MDKLMQQALNDLKFATAPCREDMHEPDEQDLKVSIIGDHLDNACGNHIGHRQITQGFQEYVVCFRRFDSKLGFVCVQVNLATLIALARKAAL